MNNTKLNRDNCFLSRDLDICNDRGELVAVATILIGKPVEDNDSAWSCSYSISGIAELNDSTYRVKGVDSIQALFGVFSVIEGTLSSTQIVQQGLLQWCGNNKAPFLR
jgi:hypothetical protein